jgi:hypothetical protein
MEYAAVIVGTIVIIALLSWMILRGGNSNASGVNKSTRPSGTGGTTSAGAGQGSSSQAQQKRNWLVGKSGEVEGKTFHVGSRTVTIGRKPTNFIQIGDSEVSRIHAQLRPAGARAALVDMNSSTGTYLNGEEITPNEKYPLEEGDSFKIGSVKFEYRMTGDFEQNHGVSSVKATGQKFETSTKMTGGAEWRDTILQQLEEADGDPKAAAEKMGIDTEVFIEMMKQANVSPDDVS